MDFKCYRCGGWPCQCKDGLTLIHGDASLIVPQLATGDCFLTDPPSGSYFADPGNQRKTNALPQTEEYIETVCVPIVNLCRQKFGRGAVMPGPRSQFFYDKPDCAGAFFLRQWRSYDSWGGVNYEPIYYYGKDPHKGTSARTTSMQLDWLYGGYNHPCSKSLRGWMWLLGKVSLKGETVVDAFCGCGTTLIAARELGRRAIGIEIEEKYCQVASHRLTQPQLSRRELVQ
jgi:hypothetical protein